MPKVGKFPVQFAGVPWVREADYAAFLAISEDAKYLPDTWEKFASYTKMAEDKWEAEGFTVVRAEIDPKTFPGWCLANGTGVNSEGRKRFAAMAAAEKQRNSIN